MQSECHSFDNIFELEPSSSSQVSGAHRTAKHAKHLQFRASPSSSAGVLRKERSSAVMSTKEDRDESTSKVSAGFRDNFTKTQAQ